MAAVGYTSLALVIWAVVQHWRKARFWAFVPLLFGTLALGQTLKFNGCGGWPTSEWGRNAVARGYAGLQIDPFVSGGLYTAAVGLMDKATGAQVGQPVAVGELEVQAVGRVFEIPNAEVESEAVFGTTLRLLGYDLVQADDNLLLTLHWQALRRKEQSYRFFVHLYDEENGELVAQVDGVPYDWTYPTTWWEAEEAISDEIEFSLAEVPAGNYVLAVGGYEPEGGGRLPVEASGSGADPAGFLALQEIRVP